MCDTHRVQRFEEKSKKLARSKYDSEIENKLNNGYKIESGSSDIKAEHNDDANDNDNATQSTSTTSHTQSSPAKKKQFIPVCSLYNHTHNINVL